MSIPTTPVLPMGFRTRKMVMSGDLNGAGSLFGGRVLEWVDQEAAVYAYCQLNYPKHLVTKAMSAIEFTSPAYLGDFVEIGLRTVGLGTTSVTLEAIVRNKKTRESIIHIDRIVFVNLLDGRPQPHGVTWESLAQVDRDEAR